MSSNKKTVTTISVDDFDPSALTFTEFKENTKKTDGKPTTQLNCFPRYKHKNSNSTDLSIQLPWMNMFTFGIPKPYGDMYKTDNDRAHIKIPLDLSNKEVMTLYTKMVALDNIFKSDEMKRKIFPEAKKLDKYQYIPLVKIPAPKDEDEEDDGKGEKPPHMKLRLDVTWPDVGIKTEVYLSTMKENGKRERTRVQVSTVDEISEYVRYKCNYSPIIEPVKMWLDKKPKMGSDKIQYGITIKTTKVQVEPSEYTQKSQTSNSDFIDDTDDMPTFKTKESESTLLQQLTKKSSNHSDDDEEEVVTKTKPVSSDEEEEDVLPPPPAKGKGKSKPVSSDEDEEDVLPPPPAKGKGKPKPVSDDDEEETVAPKKVKAKASEKTKSKSTK